MTYFRPILFATVIFVAGRAYAGPVPTTFDPLNLPVDQLESASDFDQVSVVAAQVFKEALTSVDTSETALKQRLNMKSVNVAGVTKWIESTKARIVGTEKKNLPVTAIMSPERLSSFRATARNFFDSYINEQIRLAALFHKTTSEIEIFDDNELTGFEMADREFSLTFDDGPTAKAGHSDTLITTLNSLDLHGYFFVLGENLQKRQEKAADLATLYKGQCLASHGYVHNSHQKMADPMESIGKTDALLVSYFGKNSYDFRPPYGQRLSSLSPALKPTKRKVVLWNIDSQDWHGKVDVEGMTGRVALLMLAWRRGIVLFHDVHPKANVSLPKLKKFFGTSITWRACSQGYL